MLRNEEEREESWKEREKSKQWQRGEGKQSGEMGHVHDFCAETRERERG